MSDQEPVIIYQGNYGQIKVSRIVGMTEQFSEINPEVLDNPLCFWTLRRLYQENKNTIVAINGGTGSGKSYIGLRYCEMIDPSFEADLPERLIYDPKMLFKNLRDKRYKVGSAILLDEMGLMASNRNYMSFSNKILNFMTQMFRKYRLLMVMSTPEYQFMDNAIRRLVHVRLETMHGGINYKTELNNAKLSLIDTSVRVRNKRDIPERPFMVGDTSCTHINFKAPTPSLSAKYEYLKDKFMENWFSNQCKYIETIDKSEQKRLEAGGMNWSQ